MSECLKSWARRIERVPFGVWILCCFAVLSTLAIRKHLALESHGSDLGIFVNLFWNLTHGGGWHSGMLERHFLGEHFSPMLLLVAPLFRLWPRPECLLAVQSAFLALAAWPLMKLAESRLGRRSALIVGFAYAVYPPLIGVALHDFHEVALAVPLLSLAVWWLDQHKTLPAVAALLAAVLCKEDLALVVSMVGVMLILARRDWKLGTGLLLAGGALFLLLVGVVIPVFRGGPLPFGDRYSQYPGGLAGIPAMAFRDPIGFVRAAWSLEKGRYLIHLLRPVGFLPLLAPMNLLPALPTLARNMLSNHEPQFSIWFHYPAPMIPFIFAALVGGMARLRGWLASRTPHASRWVGGWVLLCAVLWGSSLTGRFCRFQAPERTESAHALAAMIPPGDSVSAHNRLVPHVACRPEVCTFPVVREADWILLDFGYPGFEYPVHAEVHRRRLLELLESGTYQLAASRNKILLLKKTVGNTATGPAALPKDLFTSYKRENLARIEGPNEWYWQGSRWFIPPGSWEARVTVTCRRPGALEEPVVFSIHPYLGGRLDEWSLGEIELTSEQAETMKKGDRLTLTWPFEQPRSQMLTLRIENDPDLHFRLNSMEWIPLDVAGWGASAAEGESVE